jgi:outer membrane protein assembly factor BamE
MSDHFLRRLLPAAAVAAAALLAACGTVDSASNRLVSSITPYKIEIVQGNFVSKEQVAGLEKGMTRMQVKEVLGTPLITNLFRSDRWDYVFTIKRPGLEPQSRRLSVFFENDLLARFEGDEMPTEADFVAQLDSRTRLGKIPPLEATPAELAKFPGRPKDDPLPAGTAIAAEPASISSYPPLNAPNSR